MARPSPSRPTDAELAILRVLWRRGKATVREVFEELGQSRDVGYTSVLKIMQIMADKRLVVRDESSRTHVYRAREEEQQTQKRLVADLLERVFGGSARAMVLQALSARKATPDELDAIRQAIDEYARDSETPSNHENIAAPAVKAGKERRERKQGDRP